MVLKILEGLQYYMLPTLVKVGLGYVYILAPRHLEAWSFMLMRNGANCRTEAEETSLCDISLIIWFN